jgi:sugar phosphate isomerase/epimerase
VKPGVVINGPDVLYGPLALLSGSFDEKLAKAAKLGYRGIEFMVRDPAGLEWPKIKAAVQNVGLEVPQVVTGELFGADGLCLVTADDDLYRCAEARTRSVIDLAAYLGAMVNVGRLRGQLRLLGNVNDARAIAVERLRQVARYAAERGVKITLEPLNRYESDFIANAAEGRAFVADMGCDNVGLMLDMFHMNIEDVSIEQGFRQAGEKLWHIHIADSNRHYPGSGHIQYDSIFVALEDMGYHGYVSAEMLPLPDPDTAAQKTIEFLRRYIKGSAPP